MSRRYSIAQARDRLPRLVREAESGREVELTRRGKPVAVLMGRRSYEHLVSGSRSFSEAYRAFAKEHDLPSLAIDPSEVFGGARDASPGREVSL